MVESISMVLGIGITVLTIMFEAAMCNSKGMRDYNMENSSTLIKPVGRNDTPDIYTKTTGESFYDGEEYQSIESKVDLYEDSDSGEETKLENSFESFDQYEDVMTTSRSLNTGGNRDNVTNEAHMMSSKNATTATDGPTLQNTSSHTKVEDEYQTAFDNFKGDLMGWRKVDIREFPYVVSLMHEKTLVHICTGTLLTSKVVLSYIRCVVRRKSVADKVVYTVADANQIIVAAGLMSHVINDESVFRHVGIIITTYDNAFKGHLIFLILKKEVPYSIYHRPVKFYSMDLSIVGLKLQEHVGESFCEVITWEDTIICSDSKLIRPKHLKAYRVKILESNECSTQDVLLGVHYKGDWTVKAAKSQNHCFVGMGGRRCGSAPGGPIVCGNSIYGVMSRGTSCSEFGDYTDFIPVNSTELYLLYKQTLELRSEILRSLGSLKTATWILIISPLYAFLAE